MNANLIIQNTSLPIPDIFLAVVKKDDDNFFQKFKQTIHILYAKYL
jgi:hypothetical protein